MRHPQLIVYETDGRLAESLRELARKRRWALREVRQPEACLRLLRPAGPAVLVLKVGGDPVGEMTLLERVAWLAPDTARLVVGDADDAALAGLAWDLGASYVLFPPEGRGVLPDLVISAMEAGVRKPPPAQGLEAGLVGPEEPSEEKGESA
jgi:hypothetical protein